MREKESVRGLVWCLVTESLEAREEGQGDTVALEKGPYERNLGVCDEKLSKRLRRPAPLLGEM